MIKSMTGFGKSRYETDDREYQIEIKSVNHRYLDISVRIPKILNYLEEDIKKEISSHIKRGKVDIFISFEDNSQEGKEIQINKELAKTYIKQLKELAEEENISDKIEVIEIAKFPDVLTIKIDKEDEEIKNEVLGVVREAIEKMKQMRITEGDKLEKDIINRLEIIKNRIKEISEKSAGLINEYVVKLEKRVKEILKTDVVDENRLVQEVVIYADKSSIEEEITRLNSHISQIKDVLKNNKDEAVGKKLDFIIQEMNREANTIGSKANCLDITNGVIDIKTQLEDIREQIQNIE